MLDRKLNQTAGSFLTMSIHPTHKSRHRYWTDIY